MRAYRASSLGYSLCQLVCPHLGYEPASPPEWLQEKFDEGKVIEPLAIERLRSEHWVIRDSQEEVNAVGDHQIEVELEVIPNQVYVVGHLDGYVVEGGFADLAFRNVILEVKSMAHKSWQQFDKHGWNAGGIMEKYKWQASALMLATGLPLVMVAWDKETEELAFKIVQEPFYTIADIAHKLKEAECYIEEGQIPGLCMDYPCPFFYLHESKDAKEVVDADSELEAILSAWLEADKNAKVYEKEKAVLREEIIKLVGDKDLAAPVIRASNGVKVETYWQEGGEVVQKRQPKWVTKISGPRR